MTASSLTEGRDLPVDGYITRLPSWQQAIWPQLRDLIHAADPKLAETITGTAQYYLVPRGNGCGLLAANDHVNLFVYDGEIVPDPKRITTSGHSNKTARTICSRQGERPYARALTPMLEQIIVSNRAGGWRKLKPLLGQRDVRL